VPHEAFTVMRPLHMRGASPTDHRSRSWGALTLAKGHRGSGLDWSMDHRALAGLVALARSS